jgi:hypothetical protein
MANVQLTYSANPDEVAVSTGGATSQVSMALTIANGTTGSINLASVLFTLPQGTDASDLVAPDTSFSAGSVQSSNGTSWSAGVSGNAVTLLPVSPQGYATLAPNDTLIFTLSQVQITTAGAGQPATIQVQESIYNSAPGQGGITINKFNPGFQIEAFYASLYNVEANAPVTISWKVFQALSCEITAHVLDVAGEPGTPMKLRRHNPGPCGVGTANPNCDGTIVSGTDFDDSRTCNVIGATLFTLTAQGSSNGQDVSLTSQLIVTVNQPAINFSAFPAFVALGQTVSLTWVAADAGKLQLYIVPQSGNPVVKDLTSTPIGSMTDTPQVTTTYTLYAFTNASDTQPTREQSYTITVEQPQWVQNPTVSNLPAPAYPGDSFTLGWQVANVASCDLTCDVSSFTPLNGLPATGPQSVTVPDPGVPQQTANFQLIPVEYGGLGDFTPQSFQIPIQNTPNFLAPLTPNPNNGGPGAAIEMTWAVDHVDGTGALSSDFYGSSPQTVDPTTGNQSIALPDCVIPTPINYTLAVSRLSGKYQASSTARVQLNGNTTTQWCTGTNGGGGSSSYLAGLYNAHPNQRIVQIGFGMDPGYGGLGGVYLWYTQNSSPDYAIVKNNGVGGVQSTLALAPGEYILSMICWFTDETFFDSGPTSSVMTIAVTTSLGRTGGIGSGGDYTRAATVPGGQQTIAFAWNIASSDFIGALGLITCPTSYGG